MNALLDDPWTIAQIEAAIAPYAGKLTSQELAFMREQLREMLASDEQAMRVLRAAHPRDVDESGEVGCESPADEHDEKAG